jgi:hypothetical protein
MKITLITTAVILSTSGLAHADPSLLDVFTDFEGIIPNTAPGDIINVGDAAFSGPGSFAGFLGEPELYFSGLRAWMVQGQSVGRVDFAAGASLVEFWAIADPEATADASISAYDSSGDIIGMAQSLVVGNAFELFSFSGDISYILFDHTAADNTPIGMISIDDFGYNPVPTPSSIALLGLGAMATTRRRR